MGFCKISPSVICFDFLKLEQYYKTLLKYNIDTLHIDVMDGNFVKQITIGSDFVKQTKQYFPELQANVHLMVSNPADKIEDFVNAGADCITFHFDAVNDIMEAIDVIQKIKTFGVKCGITLNPNVEVEVIEELYKQNIYLDEVLVMSVQAGMSGQTFMENSVEKIVALKEILAAFNAEKQTEIWVDGGINLQTIGKVIDKVDGVVIGSALHKRHDNLDKIASFEENIKNFLDITKQS